MKTVQISIIGNNSREAEKLASIIEKKIPSLSQEGIITIIKLLEHHLSNKKVEENNENLLVINGIDITKYIKENNGRMSGHSLYIFPTFLKLFKQYPKLAQGNNFSVLMEWLKDNRPKAYRVLRDIKKNPNENFGSSSISRLPELRNQVVNLYKILNKQ